MARQGSRPFGDPRQPLPTLRYPSKPFETPWTPLSPNLCRARVETAQDVDGRCPNFESGSIIHNHNNKSTVRKFTSTAVGCHLKKKGHTGFSPSQGVSRVDTLKYPYRPLPTLADPCWHPWKTFLNVQKGWRPFGDPCQPSPTLRYPVKTLGNMTGKGPQGSARVKTLPKPCHTLGNPC